MVQVPFKSRSTYYFDLFAKISDEKVIQSLIYFNSISLLTVLVFVNKLLYNSYALNCPQNKLMALNRTNDLY